MGRRRRRQRGSGQLVPARVIGGTWSVRLVVRKGGARRRRFRGGFETRALAERALKEHQALVARGAPSFLAKEPSPLPTLATLAQPWLDRRKQTHQAHREDRLRWNKHLLPHFGHLRPDEVTAVTIRRFVESKLAEHLNPATVRILVAILSSLYVDIIDHGDGIADREPLRGAAESHAEAHQIDARS